MTVFVVVANFVATHQKYHWDTGPHTEKANKENKNTQERTKFIPIQSNDGLPRIRREQARLDSSVRF